VNSILQDVVRDKGKKRLLTIDGGGIRGVIAVEVLAEIERLLRLSTGNQQLRLSDWFHFISGCSTGAILATGLSLGMEVEELRDLYSTSGQRMFRRAGWWQRLGFHRYVHGELERLMKERFGEHTTLGSDKLKTLLMVVLKNATTDSTWLLTNSPYAQFNQPGPGTASWACHGGVLFAPAPQHQHSLHPKPFLFPGLKSLSYSSTVGLPPITTRPSSPISMPRCPPIALAGKAAKTTCWWYRWEQAYIRPRRQT